MFGWNGTILRVDLTKGAISKQPLDKRVARDYLGGRGLNIKTLFEEVKPGIDPLSPQNVLCLSSGPFTGTPLALTSRLEVSTLSPYSGILGDGNSGGYFPTELKRAGYDQVIITGRSENPRFLWIDDAIVELKDAAELWGKSTWESTKILEQEQGKDVRVAGIGQAGENLVRSASTISDNYFSAARGSGAVWGSKKLKAIAVRGTGKVEVAHPDEFMKLAKEDRAFFLTDPFHHDVVSEYGTHLGMTRWGPLFRHSDKILLPHVLPENLTPAGWKQFEKRRTSCYGCPLREKDLFEIVEGEYRGAKGGILEYESIVCLGTNCGILAPEPIMMMDILCDQYGMCTIGLGDTIAFVKALYNQGIITTHDTGGLSLEWDDDESQITLIHQTVKREGFGAVVAEGLYGAAKLLGKDAMDYCYHTKGLSKGVQSPGAMSLAHVTSTRGADHLRGSSWTNSIFYPEWFTESQNNGLIPTNIPELVVFAQRVALFPDLTGRCKCGVNNFPAAIPLVFQYPFWEGAARLLSTATGVNYDPATIIEITDRVYTLERAFNVRQGVSRNQDILPQKPNVKGTRRGEAELREHEQMLTDYYKLRGWDIHSGIPLKQTLERFHLSAVADELEANSPYPEWDGPPLWPQKAYFHS
ncbi:MAG: aldehyde ferredoxin oxidoreductase family protein [Candidatus Bathyarchaeota archaeon]|nr:MAG: aldehyde ferredoxin oxidoreductase family protein [Candidatus Bathyarchaeota archaeon]